VAVAAPWLLGLFTDDPQIRRAGTVLLWLGVLHEPARNFNFVYGTALRAAGDGRYPMLVGGISMAVVLAGGAWLLGDAFGLGLPGVWIAYTADEWLRGLAMLARWRARRWVPSTRAMFQLLEATDAAAGQEATR
jgi:Na+-driven multidrug efflux pump